MFEDIPDPHKAFGEVHRVLKPRGKHIFTVPFLANKEKDDVHAELIGGKVMWKGEPLFEVDSVRAEGIPVFQIFGRGMASNLCNMGFKVKVKALRNMPALEILGEGAVYFVAEKN